MGLHSETLHQIIIVIVIIIEFPERVGAVAKTCNVNTWDTEAGKLQV